MPRTSDNLILTDGVSTKSLSLSDYDPAWRVFGTDTAYQTQPVHEYRRVPYLFAAVDKRAKAVSGLPYGIYRDGDDEDIKDSPDFRGIVRGLRLRLYSTEAALCLYGAAYWLQSTNRFGRNARYDWIVPWSITPHYEPLAGLDYFERVTVYDNAPKAVQRLQPITERNGTLAYFWVPNLSSEVGPGVPPAQVAMAGAGILGNLTEYVASFFARGAVRPMIIKVPTAVSPAEREQVNAWWRRFFSGVRNSHRARALDDRFSVEVVGDTLDQMASDTLTTQAREDVCAALGVPHSMISADAANYATSQQDTLNFYQQTVLPSATLIAETINDQILPDGYELRFDPSQLEVYQQHEVSKAQSLQALVGGAPILTVDEARQMLGYEPLSAPEPEPEPLPEQSDNGQSIRAIKATVADLDPQERAAYRLIRGVLEEYQDDYQGDAFEQDMQEAIREALTIASVAYLRTLQDDLAALDTEGAQQAANVLNVELDALAQRDARFVRETTDENEEDGLFPLWLFGVDRALTIATTEVSRGRWQTVQAYGQQLRAIGVSVDYRWITMRDERVRPSHRALDGRLQSQGWNGIVPGEQVNCRCIAELVV